MAAPGKAKTAGVSAAGTVFEVRRFAVHDGPGVRTVFFLKGCPLRCRWCHNPEGIGPRPELAFHSHKCIHCGECARVCPRGAHALAAGKHVFDRAKCAACGACAEACLGRALKLFGRRISVEEAAALALEDREFYRDGGGVTLSGGEPLAQAGLCAGLLERLKKEGIHCAVDTSGAVAWTVFERALPWTDLFLYDLKHVDDGRHREMTGRSNRVPIEVRIPVIPGFNDGPESVDAMGALLAGLRNIAGVRLLPYHPARSKYEAVGRPDAMPAVEAPSREKMAALAARLRKFPSLQVRGS
jgi:glycyl-radical enzyme activating protein